ncbi:MULTISPECIES: DoxX family protein [Myroides]|uniref:DoxX family protein n=1 Tax=Flavobacteriales TaxID=200644 RepID=UPI002577EC42|nr:MULTISPECIES: DoxX family protein [Myroides]MDM1326606.1 DoxX family protein [Myroides odoratimimus]MDM1408533.1 DoxX family protein [Myroides sp. DF42-4-2]MDM1450899.1 DoxX family protein [Myroides odoratimimus]
MDKKNQINGLSVLLLRITLSGIFIVAGVSHLLNPEGVTQRIQNAPYSGFATLFGDPHLLGILSGYVLLVFGIALLLGVFTRWSAIILFITLIPITITIQMGNGLIHGPLWKNIALFGGLLFFILNNPKSFSLYNK